MNRLHARSVDHGSQDTQENEQAQRKLDPGVLPSPYRQCQRKATNENEYSGDWQNQVNHVAECEPFMDLGSRLRRPQAKHDGYLQADSDKQTDHTYNVKQKCIRIECHDVYL